MACAVCHKHGRETVRLVICDGDEGRVITVQVCTQCHGR